MRTVTQGLDAVTLSYLQSSNLLRYVMAGAERWRRQTRPLYAASLRSSFFFFQAEDGIRDVAVTGVQTCALPICDPAHRPGHGAWHVQPAASGAARHGDRATLRADSEPPRRPRAVRAAQQPALRVRLSRIRVRLCRRGARGAGAVGGAVRRLHERRRGDHRPVPHRRARKVGADLAPHAATAAWLRGSGPGALERPDRAVPRARRGREHPHRELHDARAVLPPVAPPGTASGAAPARPLHAEEPAATAPGDVAAREPDERGLPARARRR